MKRFMTAALTAALLLAAAVPARAEGTQVQVYVAKGALSRDAALRLVALAGEAYPQAAWSAVFEEETGESLRELVLADRAPQIAVCAPQEALFWADEGLLVPLDGAVRDTGLMEPQVVQACVRDETLLMAPLAANHRRVAVNARALEAAGLGYLLDRRAHPVWMPSELYQIVEALSESGAQAMELWLPGEDTAAGIEAFVQSLYGGALVGEDGACLADSETILAGLTWVDDMVEAGVIGVVRDRQTALEHFAAGQTALFVDWTDEEAARWRSVLSEDVDLCEIPYPTADTRSVRAFELVGAAVFAGHDATAMRLAEQGVALWSEDDRAQSALGARGIWRDGAVWLPCLSALPAGATLRSLFAQAVREVLDGESEPEEALCRAAGVYRAVAER